MVQKQPKPRRFDEKMLKFDEKKLEFDEKMLKFANFLKKSEKIFGKPIDKNAPPVV